MANSITDGSTTVSLPDDLVWRNEFDTTQIAQATKRTLGGQLVVSESLKVKGRNISLESDEDSGWTTRLNLNLLRGLAEQVDKDMTLTFNGFNYTVRFDRSSGSGIKAVPVIDCSNPSDENQYALSITLITV